MSHQNGTKRTTNLGYGVAYIEPASGERGTDYLYAETLISEDKAMTEAADLAAELLREFDFHHVPAPTIKYFQEHDLQDADGPWWAGLDLAFDQDAIDSRQRINHVTRRRGMISSWIERRGSYLFYRVRITRWALSPENDAHCNHHTVTWG
jgi:hypothetical protein